MNLVILQGNITRDPEFKNIGTTNVCNFCIAVNRVKQGGEKETTFVDVSAFGKTAENISKYFQKGKMILIEGRLKLDEWLDTQSGQKRTKLKVVAGRFYFCGSNSGQGDTTAKPAQQAAAPQGNTGQTPAAPASPFV